MKWPLAMLLFIRSIVVPSRSSKIDGVIAAGHGGPELPGRLGVRIELGFLAVRRECLERLLVVLAEPVARQTAELRKLLRGQREFGIAVEERGAVRRPFPIGVLRRG